MRWGLAAKLFAILTLLGAVAVLVTGVLGYMRARDALQESIYNQLTATRKSKARQVETYFRTIRNELSQLAVSKMAIDAARGFNAGFDELDRSDVPFDLRRQVGDWYEEQFLPGMRRILGKEPNVNDYLPVGPAAYYLQYHYIVANPYPADRRKLLDDAGDGSAYSAQHAIYHPLLRAATTSFGFFDLMLANPKSGRIVYGVVKEVDLGASLRTGPYRQSNLAAAVARCGAMADRSAVCLEDFAPYAPSGGAPIAFMAAPVIDQGQVIGVLVAQLSIEEIDSVVTGDRRWRQDGFGDTGEAYLVGSDHFVRSGPRAFYESPDRYFIQLKQGGASEEEIDAIRRYGTPVLQQRVATDAAKAALAGVEGTGEIVGYRGVPTLASWGPLAIPAIKWALIAKIDTSEAFAPIYRLQHDLMIVGGLALLVVIVTGAWLSRSLLGPLRELTAGVTRFAAGDYGAKVPVRTRDEIGALCTAFNGMVEELRDKNVLIENKNRENEELLLNVLPAPIANRLRGGEQGIADGFAEVTVAFADLVGFTAMSSEMPPADVVSLLNGLFTRFDDAAHELGIEKIKTVGDAYMAVCGMPVQVP
ncbi:MAG TPA: adenylate/guanylate cyclase domain-containing protein, partial [Reyranella sp.]|nr:adenylate/guanylate cyclase domain-containing protein [Reyranella sp.]